ncbi:phospholipase D-like domain-containing protein [Falsibacillus albus]|uniref:Cardiolipin synthase n=1 Tax=Falsibacillus albus TaxID=2478915 RepID=A0A3L7JRN6_9BACI|nr:phospholipase D-like domain-containing protein [Falsibacillus albus]RLQ93473.1 cardiolipin synthase [Falsibacillus albus]
MGWLAISGIIIGILIVLILLLILDFELGLKKYIKTAAVRTYPKRSSSMDIIASGPELFELMFADIKAATTQIYTLFYIVKDDDFSRSFLALLEQKAKQGLEVKLLVDYIGGHKIDKGALKKAQDAGVRFEFCNRPYFPYFFFSLQQRNHRKITVIDGKIGYLGGYNVGKEYIDDKPKLSPWRDYHLRMEGEGVEDLHQEFLIDWKRSSKQKDDYRHPDFSVMPKGSTEHMHFPSEGVRMEEELCRLLRETKQSLYIGTPYFIPTKKVFKEVLSAMDRGVTLKVIVPEKADHPLVKEASYPYLWEVIKRGALVHQFLNGFYHAKVLIIDGKMCDIGTANFDRRSFLLNNEMNCFIYDPVFIGRVMEVMDKDMGDSHQLTFDELKQLRKKAVLKEALAKSIQTLL